MYGGYSLCFRDCKSSLGLKGIDSYAAEGTVGKRPLRQMSNRGHIAREGTRRAGGCIYRQHVLRG